jgi:RND family efflux transporter MFP subunit
LKSVMHVNRYLAAASIATFFLIGMQSGCAPSSRAEGEQPKSPAQVDRVAVAAVRRGPLRSDLRVTAEFQPDHELDVMAKVSGYLKKVEVDVGDRVRQGQLLATIEVPEMEDDIARTAAAIVRARSELARAAQEVKRAETSRELTQISYSRLASVMERKPGLVAQQELDSVRNRDLLAQSQIDTAKTSQTVAENSLRILEVEANRLQTLKAYTRVLAPFDGLVTKRYAETGGMIQAAVASQTQALPVVRVAQTGILRLIIPVPESVVPAIRRGAPVEVAVPTLRRSFQGRVARASGQIQPSTRTMETQVDVPNPQGLLVPGMFAEAVIGLDKRTDSLLLPAEAIDQGKDGKPTVLLVPASGILERRPISIGLETAETAEIRSGLSEGDQVVIGNRNRFQPGQKVEPRLASAEGRK